MPAYDWSDRTRTLLATARDEAARRGHEYVGPEHLLLALITDERATATAILRELGATAATIRTTTESVLAAGTATGLVGLELPYTSRAKVVLEQAMHAAAGREESTIGTEHLLLGLLREGQGIAAQVLGQLGVTPERVLAALDGSD